MSSDVGQSIGAGDARNLEAALAGSGATEGFLTAVAPASAAFNAVDDYYHNERDYVMAMAEALRQEYLEVYRSGLILQVDDAVLANMYDHLVQRSPKDYRKWAELRIEALVYALRDIPPEHIRYHVVSGAGICRTQWMRRWRRSSISSSRYPLRLTRWRQRIRATSMNGACGSGSNCRPEKYSFPG